MSLWSGMDWCSVCNNSVLGRYISFGGYVAVLKNRDSKTMQRAKVTCSPQSTMNPN
jgi:hypothetical protein